MGTQRATHSQGTGRGLGPQLVGPTGLGLFDRLGVGFMSVRTFPYLANFCCYRLVQSAVSCCEGLYSFATQRRLSVVWSDTNVEKTHNIRYKKRDKSEKNDDLHASADDLLLLALV